MGFVFEVLVRIEQLLREHYAKQDPEKAKTFVLRDHFDFLAGTSTGAIIATCLCWGMPVETVRTLYLEQGKKMFEKVSWRNPIKKLLYSHYNPAPLSDFLQRIFVERDGTVATLASPRLREGERNNFLMVVVRNHTTGSAWPLTNNPDAVYNDLSRPDCNLQVPLWKLVRASTAAPVFFPPEKVLLGETESVFVDGSITPYSNPALIASLTAILPGYHMDWPTGPDKIRVVSIGTLTFSSELAVSNPAQWLGVLAAKIPAALLQSMGWQQDYLCRCLGECIYGDVLDGEVGYLVDAMDAASKNSEGKPKYPVWRPRPSESWFSYVRYNRTFKKTEMLDILRQHPDLARLDAVDGIPHLTAIGKAYAEANVKIEHLV